VAFVPRQRSERGEFLRANLLRERTARVEPAARRRIDGTRDLALGQHFLLADVGVRHRYRRQQRPRIRMLWIAIDLIQFAHLTD
jgi:hypothetical protein